MGHIIFSQSSVDAHLGWSSLLNRAALNMNEQISLWCAVVCVYQVS